MGGGSKQDTVTGGRGMMDERRGVRRRKEKMRGRESFTVFLKGFLMGVCDLIPGISGGTIAFITGIYYR